MQFSRQDTQALNTVKLALDDYARSCETTAAIPHSKSNL